MQYITTTQLRTKTSSLISTLAQGLSVSLIHRSKVVGKIKPAKKSLVTITDIDDFNDFLDSLKPKKQLSPKQEAKAFTNHLKKKYG